MPKEGEEKYGKLTSEEAKKAKEDGIERYIDLMKTYEQLPEEVLADKNDTFMGMKYKLPPALFSQCIIHGTDICDKVGNTRKGIEVLETAFKYNNHTLANHR